MSEETERQYGRQDVLDTSSQASKRMGREPLPELKTPHHKRKLFRTLGLAFVAIDLAIMPITYYFAFKYGTNLSLQTGKLLGP